MVLDYPSKIKTQNYSLASQPNYAGLIGIRYRLRSRWSQVQLLSPLSRGVAQW